MTTTSSFGNVTDSISIAGVALRRLANEVTIGEMADEYSISTRTLRFYEERCLLRPRRKGRTRLYSGADRLRLQMIVGGKRLGFTITEIAELIGTENSIDNLEEKLQPAQITTQIGHLQRQRREIDDAIMRLETMHARLAQAPDRHEQFLAASG
jgi:DNA-binding transcriptional MerR regulator